MRVAGYLRVSTDRQADDGFGLDVQEAAVRRWASEKGHELVALARDEGISGTLPAHERPGLADALNLIADGGAQGLVVMRLDRLARALDVQEAALAHVWKVGGKVFSVDSGEILEDDPDDPVRTAMRQMMGVFGQLERGMIAARLRAGRKMKAERGGFAYGSPPLGFRAEGRELVAEESEQVAVEKIAELKGRGCTLRQIASTLTSQGIPTKRGRSVWHPSSVRKVVMRLESAK